MPVSSSRASSPEPMPKVVYDPSLNELPEGLSVITPEGLVVPLSENAGFARAAASTSTSVIATAATSSKVPSNFSFSASQESTRKSIFPNVVGSAIADAATILGTKTVSKDASEPTEQGWKTCLNATTPSKITEIKNNATFTPKKADTPATTKAAPEDTSGQVGQGLEHSVQRMTLSEAIEAAKSTASTPVKAVTPAATKAAPKETSGETVKGLEQSVQRMTPSKTTEVTKNIALTPKADTRILNESVTDELSKRVATLTTADTAASAATPAVESKPGAFDANFVKKDDGPAPVETPVRKILKPTSRRSAATAMYENNISRGYFSPEPSTTRGTIASPLGEPTSNDVPDATVAKTPSQQALPSLNPEKSKKKSTSDDRQATTVGKTPSQQATSSLKPENSGKKATAHERHNATAAVSSFKQLPDSIKPTNSESKSTSHDRRNATVTQTPSHQALPAPRPENSAKKINSPFYSDKMTLGIAAQNIVAYFHEANQWLTFWNETTSASKLDELICKPGSNVIPICSHFVWTAEFLQLGRKGWLLTHLPDEFFRDVLPLVGSVEAKLLVLCKWQGCEGVMGKAARDVKSVKALLERIKAARKEEGKAKWLADSNGRKA
ncbi:hypothetical protein Q7P37_000401 [Cladosporium fusiforme]